MTLTKKAFAGGIALLAENFHLSVGQKYSELIFPILKSAGITDEVFQGKVREIIFTKTKSEFFTLPAVADWLEFFGKKQKALSLKEMAILACSSVLEEARKAKLSEEAVTFQNQITNAAIESLGGLGSIQKRISDDSWHKKESFFRKEFEEIWMTFFKAKKISNVTFGVERKELCDFERYSTTIDGVERWGVRPVNIQVIENPKRVVPDLSQNQSHIPANHQVLSINKASNL